MKNYKEEKARKIKETEEIIRKYLPKEGGYQSTVIEAMNYSVEAGGKRLRPMLMQEVFHLFGGKTKAVEPFMAAMEMIHTYSLVHDDLPAMDNDEYRRGRKTTHVVYGECMAILAGDGLLNYAFETACQAFDLEEENKKVARAMKVLAKKAGIFGMIGGQTADIEAETLNEDQVTKELLLFIHKNKTAALIEASMMIGAILAGATEEEISAIEKIGYNIGIAFQVQDDILDVTGSLEMLGKMTGSDEKNHKVTYVSLMGMEKAKEEVKRLSNEAVILLKSFEKENEFLNELIKELITREK